MTTAAYYRSWSKRVEKHPHGHSNLLAVQKPLASGGEAVQSGEEMAVSAA
jgi:hypothetical protein